MRGTLLSGGTTLRLAMTALVAFVMVCCCSILRQEARLSDQDQIREAVFRFQFQNNASGLQDAAHAYYLRTEDNRDPGPELLARFRDHRPRVKPGSHHTLKAGTAQVIGRDSGLPGLLFRIELIRWLDPQEVLVEGGYEEASESGSVETFRLGKRFGRWRVVEHHMLLIK